MEMKKYAASILVVLMMGAWLANANRVLNENPEQAHEIMGGKEGGTSGGTYCTIM